MRLKDLKCSISRSQPKKLLNDDYRMLIRIAVILELLVCPRHSALPPNSLILVTIWGGRCDFPVIEPMKQWKETQKALPSLVFRLQSQAEFLYTKELLLLWLFSSLGDTRVTLKLLPCLQSPLAKITGVGKGRFQLSASFLCRR